MTLRDLTTLLDYHYWARDRLLDGLEPLPRDQFTRDLGSSFLSIRDTVAHLHSAEWAWHARWNGQSPSVHLPADRFADVGSVREAWASLEHQVRSFVDDLGEAGIGRVFDYRTLDGSPASAVFWQMLLHLVNHASYHRGQVATMVRQLGARPARPMDLIAYYRSRAKS